MENRLRESSRMLDLSYRLISHYDSKTNPLLAMISFNFVIVGFILTGFFSNIEKFEDVPRISVMVFSSLNFFFVMISIILVVRALVPHTSKVDKNKPKPKLGLTYFKDVIEGYSEEDYIKTWLARKEPPKSPYYKKENNEDALIACLIEDNCRDFYAHAEILSLKTSKVKNAFRIVLFNMSFLFTSIIVLGVIFIIYTPVRQS